MRVLLVEDHTELAATVAEGLRREGTAVDLARDGDAALERTSINRYDVVVLDRDLPGVHGDEVCRRLIAEGYEARVLMLTAAATIEDRVEGLTTGADDYLPKPFAFAELVARIRALGRRAQPAVPPVLVHGDLRVDPGRRLATRAGRRLDLSPVRVWTGVHEGRPSLRVSNAGPRIPLALMGELFQPFRRMGSARTGEGLGLGLSMVAAIAAAHDARVDARPIPDGGLEVLVAF